MKRCEKYSCRKPTHNLINFHNVIPTILTRKIELHLSPKLCFKVKVNLYSIFFKCYKMRNSRFLFKFQSNYCKILVIAKTLHCTYGIYMALHIGKI